MVKGWGLGEGGGRCVCVCVGGSPLCDVTEIGRKIIENDRLTFSSETNNGI